MKKFADLSKDDFPFYRMCYDTYTMISEDFSYVEVVISSEIDWIKLEHGKRSYGYAYKMYKEDEPIDKELFDTVFKKAQNQLLNHIKSKS